MDRKNTFQRTVFNIALPVTLQSLLQSSFGVIDQIMIGQLGSGSIAGIGLGAKFASLYSVVLAAVASAAGIMISQYMGKKDEEAVGRSFILSLTAAVGLAAGFLALCVTVPEPIMAIYTRDAEARELAVKYLRILSVSFPPMAVSSLLTTMLRCMEAAALPLYANIFALALNTGLNYLLIFGTWGFPRMGVEGAALASVIAQIISCLVILLFFLHNKKKRGMKRLLCLGGKHSQSMSMVKKRGMKRLVRRGDLPFSASGEFRRQYLGILCPLLVCEFLWSLGENVYTAIYGNIGTDACAAMTMTVPVQTIVIGALSGLAQASGILIGKSLGAGQYEQAYAESKKLMKYGLSFSVLLSLLLAIVSPLYVKIYPVEPQVQEITESLLLAIALIAPVKVLNMILGGGIIRSGGKTRYAMWIDLTGTWIFGVPLGLLAAFVWKLPVTPVYVILSLEECVRLGISLVVFRKKIWMESIL